jgi:hypothetical protein
MKTTKFILFLAILFTGTRLFAVKPENGKHTFLEFGVGAKQPAGSDILAFRSS